MAEIKQLEEINAFRIAERKPNEKVAKMKIVFQVSLDNDFQLKFKVRIVLCGYSQIYGVNYLVTYAPTISKDTLKLVLIQILKEDMIIKTYDVSCAFMEGKNDFRIISKWPEELNNTSNEIIVEWISSLYGEKQAAYRWYIKLKEILCNHLGFEVSEIDEALFILKNKDSKIIMLDCPARATWAVLAHASF